MKNLILCLTLVITSLSFFAQSPSIQWAKRYGGSLAEEARCVQQTSDGGYIIAGRAQSNDGDVIGNDGITDYWIVKVDYLGNIQWQKTYGGAPAVEIAYCIRETIDGGYIVVGGAGSFGGDVSGIHEPISSSVDMKDMWVVKLDNSGIIQWQKCLGGGQVEVAYSVEQTSDGGYIVTGFTKSNDGDVNGNNGDRDAWVVKLNNTGNIVWQKCLGGTWPDEAMSIKQTSDGGYILVGNTSSNNGDVSGLHGYFDGWIVKLSSNGNIQWQKCIGGSENDYLNSIQLTQDGGYIVAGRTASNDGDVSGNHNTVYYDDLWIVKIDQSGNIQWQKCFGGTSVEVGYSIDLTSDGGYIICGIAGSNDGDVTGLHYYYDYWVIKTDSNGNLQWQKCFGGSYWDFAHSIQQTTDGGYIVAGYASSSDGDVGGIQGNYDYWVVKLGPAVGIENEITSQINIYPNPAKNLITVSIPAELVNSNYSLIDQAVRTVLTGVLNNLNNSLDISALAKGLYIMQVGEQRLSLKMIKE
jgi:hypothetical protein